MKYICSNARKCTHTNCYHKEAHDICKPYMIHACVNIDTGCVYILISESSELAETGRCIEIISVQEK